jgi:hypothetical protein
MLWQASGHYIAHRVDICYIKYMTIKDANLTERIIAYKNIQPIYASLSILLSNTPAIIETVILSDVKSSKDCILRINEEQEVNSWTDKSKYLFNISNAMYTVLSGYIVHYQEHSTCNPNGAANIKLDGTLFLTFVPWYSDDMSEQLANIIERIKTLLITLDYSAKVLNRLLHHQSSEVSDLNNEFEQYVNGIHSRQSLTNSLIESVGTFGQMVAILFGQNYKHGCDKTISLEQIMNWLNTPMSGKTITPLQYFAAVPMSYWGNSITLRHTLPSLILDYNQPIIQWRINPELHKDAFKVYHTEQFAGGCPAMDSGLFDFIAKLVIKVYKLLIEQEDDHLPNSQHPARSQS